MRALLVVDIQNDFCPGGSLAVPEGDQIVPIVNRLTGEFEHVIFTQDWHPAGHLSFASSYEGKEPYDRIQLDYGEQILWPDHCVQGTPGAEFRPDLDTTRGELIIRKGFRREIDSYSTFFENDRKTPTGLAGYLRERGIRTLYLAGLALDFCVHWSAVDGRREGFDIVVIEDACRAIDAQGSLDQALKRMREVETEFTTSDAVLASIEH